MKIYVKAINFEMCVINGLFIYIYYINNKIVNKLNNRIWIEDDMRKVKLEFKAKHFMFSALSTREYLFVFNYISAKEVYYALEVIHGEFPKITQEKLTYISMKMKHQTNMKVVFVDGCQTLESLGVLLKYICLTNISNSRTWESNLSNP